MSKHNLMSSLQNETRLFQQNRSAPHYFSGRVGKLPDQFSTNQLIQFDNPSPGLSDPEIVVVKSEALDFSQPSSKHQQSGLNRRHSLPPTQGPLRDGVLPTRMVTSDHLHDVYFDRGNSPSWYSDVTSIIATDSHFQPTTFSISRGIDNGYQHPMRETSIHDTVIKYNGSPAGRPVTPTSIYSDSERGTSHGKQLWKNEPRSPCYNEKSGTDESQHSNHVHDVLYDSTLHQITPVHSNSSMYSGGQHSGENSPVTSQHIMPSSHVKHDVYSTCNSVDSVSSMDDNSVRYDHQDLNDNSNAPFLQHTHSGASHRHQPHQIHQYQQSANDIENNNYTAYHRQPMSASSSVSSLSPSSSSAGQQSSFSTASINDSSPGDPRSYPVDGISNYKNGDKSQKTRPKSGKQPRGAQNLPPCRVCGNKASGLHFGVNTCEACNEFFRRSLKRGATYYCTKNRECQVYGKKRNACSYCRYHRCVEMGMSRTAIKTGRYSHKTRTEYAMEVEEFRHREMNRVESEKYENLLTDLVKYHDKYVNVTTRIPEGDLHKSQNAYLQLYRTQREHELRHPPLSSTMQSKSLANGWRTDEEDISLTMHDVEMTERWLRNYINFAKNVPGFKELALSDQASLVRGSWFEFWFLGAFRGYNSKIRVVIYPNKRCFHEEEIKKVFGEEYTEFSFYLGDRMRSLNVTPEEMVLVKTICLTFPDRTPLENKEAVEKMHWLMVSCLLHTLEKNRPGDKTIFPLMVSKLVELRTLTDIAMRAHKRTLFQDVLKDSPLLCEMVDTKTRYVQCVLHQNAAHVTKCPIEESP